MITKILSAIVFLCASAALLAVTHLPPLPMAGFSLGLLAAGLFLFMLPELSGKTSQKLKWVCLGVGLLGLALLLSYRINLPWSDHRSANGAIWSFHGRNIARHGFIETKGVLYSNGGPVLDKQAPIANHHPPGMVWLLAILFKLFGPHEYVARSLPATATLAGVSALGIWVLVRFGLVATGAFLLAVLSCPAVTYIGRMVNFEPLILAFSLVFYVTLDLFAKSRGWTGFRLAGLAIVPWIGWVGGIWALVAAWFASRNKPRWHRVGIWAIPLLSLAAVVLFVSNSESGGVSGSLHRSVKWSYTTRPADMPGLLPWLKAVGRHITVLVPFPLFLLGACLLGRSLRQTLPRKIVIGTLLPFALLLPIMPHAFVVHNYHIMSLWPLAVLVAALAGKSVSEKPIPKAILALFLLSPLLFGMKTYLRMNKETYANSRAETQGKALNKLIPPQGKVGLVNARKKFEPVLWYYLDRHFLTYWNVDQALEAIAAWDYCFIPANKRTDSMTVPKPYSLKPIYKDPNGATLYQKMDAP